MALAWMVLCSVLFGPPPAGPSGDPDGPAVLAIPFIYEPERGAIVLELTADRRTAQVLLDTGAARTVLSADFLGVDTSSREAARFFSGRPGVSGDGLWMRTPLALGGCDLGQGPVRIMDFSEVSRVYKRRVDGLLGQDILTRFQRVEIDFRARRLRLIGSRP
jgi:hypothetical protein